MRRGVVLLALGLLVACGDDTDGAAVSTTIAGSSTADPTTTATSTGGGAGNTDATTTTVVVAEGSTEDQGTTTSDAPREADVQSLTFAELFERRFDLVGSTIEVEGTVHFISRCPPPPPEGGRPEDCVLLGFLAAEDRTFLAAGDVGQAIPIAEGGVQVQCRAPDAPTGACPGWEHARRYRLTGVVERRVAGGRELDEVQLEVTSKTPR